VEKLTASEKAKLIKFAVVLISTAVAIIIFSLTVGRELYYGERNNSLVSFALIHFPGYLFFLLMPVEIAFIYYLPYFSKPELIAVALITAETAQVIDYLIGYSLSSRLIYRIVSEKQILKAEKQIYKYGNLTILLFNLLPLSSSVISLAAGMIRYRFKLWLLYSTTGLIIKYVFLSLVF
jgi:membrane protein DedA with SNARE-associated domain